MHVLRPGVRFPYLFSPSFLFSPPFARGRQPAAQPAPSWVGRSSGDSEGVWMGPELGELAGELGVACPLGSYFWPLSSFLPAPTHAESACRADTLFKQDTQMLSEIDLVSVNPKRRVPPGLQVLGSQAALLQLTRAPGRGHCRGEKVRDSAGPVGSLRRFS